MSPHRTTRPASPVDRTSGPEVRPRPGSPLLAAGAAAVLLVGIALFHAALALGAPWGEYTQGGGTVGTLTTSGRVTAVLAGLALAYAGVAVLLNLVTRSAAEREVWAPVSIVLLGLVGYVLRSARSDRAHARRSPD